jgi:hypothetical protein
MPSHTTHPDVLATRHPWRPIVTERPVARRRPRAGFALPTVREVPRRAPREPAATW